MTQNLSSAAVLIGAIRVNLLNMHVFVLPIWSVMSNVSAEHKNKEVGKDQE